MNTEKMENMKKDLESIKDHYKPVSEGGRYTKDSTNYTFAKAILLLMEAMEGEK